MMLPWLGRHGGTTLSLLVHCLNTGSLLFESLSTWRKSARSLTTFKGCEPVPGHYCCQFRNVGDLLVTFGCIEVHVRTFPKALAFIFGMYEIKRT